MHLTLIRHAESTWNATGQWQGQSDVPLTPRGRLQARALAQRMFGATFDHAYASDLSRVAETAAALGVQARQDPRLREIDVGAWAGLTHAEVRERFGDQVEALRGGHPVRIGGGESMEEFEARVDGVVDELHAQHEGSRVLLVTHGGVVRALTARLLDMRGRGSALVGVGNTALTSALSTDGRLVLERYNDERHLELHQDTPIARHAEPTTRMTVIAVSPEEAAERSVVDALLGGLGVARYYAVDDVRDAPLAVELFAEPMPGGGVAELHAEHLDGGFAVLAPRETVPIVVAGALGLGPSAAAGLAAPSHAAVAQIRLFAKRAELYSYGVGALDDG